MHHVATSLNEKFTATTIFFFCQNSRLKLLRKLALIFMARNEWAVLEILITVMPTSYQNSEA